MAFSEELANHPPRDSSGARTSSRYDFQKNWALCKLIELYTTMSDFLVLLDYHEDIVVLNKEFSPDAANFYQVKTKTSGNWSITALTARHKGKDGSGLPSIFDKLYSAHIRFREGTRELCFVSNRPVNVMLIGKSARREVRSCTFRELHASEKKVIHECLEGGAASECDYEGLCKLRAMQTDLSLSDHESHTKGQLITFFEKIYPQIEVATTAIYRTLFDEIRRKTNDDNNYSDFSSLTKAKGISRSEFHNIVSIVGNRPGVEAMWGTARAYLVKESVPPAILKMLKTEFFNYAVSHMNPVDEDAQSLTKDIRALLAENKQEWESLELKITAENIYSRINAANIGKNYSSEFIKAAAIYEVLNETIPETDSQSTDANL